VNHIYPSISCGYGKSHGHHGELFQGQIEDSAGRRRRCLISLPCYSLWSEVRIAPNDTGILRVSPRHKAKAARVVEATFDHLGVKGVGGHITVASNIEEGKGYGSSTADCVAAVRAAANCAGYYLPEIEVARLVVANETASDNVMFRGAVLFAQREAVVLEDYNRLFPPMDVLGVDADCQSYVDTLVYPPAEYHWRHIGAFQMLVAALRRAFRTGDLQLLGQVATASSMINEQFLPKRLFPEIRRLAELSKIAGISVAHTGTIVGLILDPADPRLEHKMEFLTKGLDSLGLTKMMRFRTVEESGAMETAA
jgi:uncharacterized protein involved in propanediol utilization